MSEMITLYFWDHNKDEEFEVTTTLESIIKNPGGYKMDQIGLILFNLERRKLGLTEYKFNPETRTYDENRQL
jgi:hypothetical protein